MSSLAGRVGGFALEWLSVPRGNQGTALVRINGDKEAIEIRWRQDADGIWIEVPEGARGFDISGDANDDGAPVYRVTERLGANEWMGLSFRRAGEEQTAAASAGQRKGLRVRAQMPGKIVRVLVKEGQLIERGQSLVVMEAMKMENEIRAPGAGTVKSIKVTEGQVIESGADLILLE